MDVLIIFATPAFLLCVGLAIIRFRRLSFRDDIAVRAPPMRRTAAWLAGFIVLMVVGEAVSRWAGFEDPSGTWRGKYDAAALAIRVFAVGLLYPVVEEFFFRGVLLGIIKRQLNAIAAVAVSSLAFALVHLQYDWRQMVLILADAVFFGTCRVRTRSLFPSMAFHIIGNSFAIWQRLYG